MSLLGNLVHFENVKGTKLSLISLYLTSIQAS